jgi:hypothetical protein
MALLAGVTAKDLRPALILNERLDIHVWLRQTWI